MLDRVILNGVDDKHIIKFDYLIRQEDLPEEVFVQSISMTDKALNGFKYDNDSRDNIIDVIDTFPLISIEGFSDFNKNGAPDICNVDCDLLNVSEDNVINPLYYQLQQSVYEFASLTPTVKIIVTSSEGENFFDVARYISNSTSDNPVSVVGETFLISGSSNIDGFMVQPGVKYDLTNLKGAIDKLYFSGPLAEYVDSILLDSSTGVMQVSRLTDVGEEIVQFIATASAEDTLIFTDGALSSADVKVAVSGQTPLTDLTFDTSIKSLDDKTISGATVKHIVLNSDGGNVATNDLVIFADQQLDTSTIKQQL